MKKRVEFCTFSPDLEPIHGKDSKTLRLKFLISINSRSIYYVSFLLREEKIGILQNKS